MKEVGCRPLGGPTTSPHKESLEDSGKEVTLGGPYA